MQFLKAVALASAFELCHGTVDMVSLAAGIGEMLCILMISNGYKSPFTVYMNIN